MDSASESNERYSSVGYEAAWVWQTYRQLHDGFDGFSRPQSPSSGPYIMSDGFRGRLAMSYSSCGRQYLEYQSWKQG